VTTQRRPSEEKVQCLRFGTIFPTSKLSALQGSIPATHTCPACGREGKEPYTLCTQFQNVGELA
jgi:hypothetical protein